MPPSTPSHGPDAPEESERIYARPEADESDDAFAVRFADAVIEMVNRWRAANGLPPLVKDNESK